MARQVLPWVGAIVGAYFGNPQLGFMIGSLIGNAVDPQVIKAPSIGDGQQTTSQVGVPRPIIYGTACVGGNIFDKGPLVKKKKKTRQGKGGPVVESEHFYLTYALRICEGPVAALLRIWEDEKLIYDARPGSAMSGAENNKTAARFRFFNGSETQMPSPDLEAIHGAGNTPAYRGTAYIVFPNADVTDRRGSVPNYRFEVATQATVVQSLSLTTNAYMYGGDIDGLTQSFAVPEGAQRISLHKDAKLLAYSRMGSLGPEVYVAKLNTEGTSFDHQLAFDFGPVGTVSEVAFSPDGGKLAVLSFTQDESGLSGDVYLTVYTMGSDSLTRLSETHEVALAFPDAYAGFSWAMDSSKLALVHAKGARVISPDGEVLATKDFEGMGKRYSGVDFSRDGTELLAYGYLDGHELLAVEVLSSDTLARKGSMQLPQDGIVYDQGTGRGYFSSDDKRIYFLPPTAGVCLVLALSDDSPPAGMTYALSEESRVHLSGFGESSYYYYAPALSQDRKYLAYLYTVSAGPSQVQVLELLGPSMTPVAEQPVSPNAAGTVVRFAETTASGTTVTTDYAPLKYIVEDISKRCQIDPGKIDTTDINGLSTKGLVLAGQFNGGNAIRALQSVYFFDPAEWDRRVRFIRRGKSVVETVATWDMVDEPDKQERKNPLEYPRKLELMYQNAKIGYAPAKATSERMDPTLRSSGETTIEVPVVLTEDEAAQLADKQHKLAWAEAEGEVTFRLPDTYDYLTPTDCLGVFIRGRLVRVRIEKIERADGVLTITSKVDRQSAYTSNVTGLPLPEPPPPPSTIAGDPEFAFLNIAALVDNADILHYYIACAGVTEAWQGCVVERAVNGGEYADIKTITTASVMGNLLDPLPASSEHYPDTTNRLRVKMVLDGEVQSVTQEQLLQEKNAWAICRPDGTAEIIQIRDAMDEGEGIYSCSYLLRGRLNSGATAHATGARVVLLDSVEIVPVQSALIDAELTHRPVSFGEQPETSPVYTHAYAPALSQLEFPVDQLTAQRMGASVSIAWSPRERFGTDLRPVRSANWGGYRVEVSDGSATLTQTTLDPAATIDTSTLTGPLTVTVSQINRFTGPGPSTSITVP